MKFILDNKINFPTRTNKVSYVFIFRLQAVNLEQWNSQEGTYIIILNRAIQRYTDWKEFKLFYCSKLRFIIVVALLKACKVSSIIFM